MPLDIPQVSSSLELASKNIVCGSVKMVYALIYTLFLVNASLPLRSYFSLIITSNLRDLVCKLATTFTCFLTQLAGNTWMSFRRA